MRNLFFIAILISIGKYHAFAQGVLNIPDNNILYRGYNNKIQLGDGNYKKKTIITGDGVNLRLLDSVTKTYSASVSGSKKEATVLVLSKNLRDTLDRIKFRVANLPPPELFLGNAVDGEEAKLDSVISCGYDDGKIIAPTSVVFVVLSYEMIIAGETKTYKGSGGVISNEGMMALQEALAKPREKEFIYITIQTTIKGSDGVTRKKSGSYKLK